MVMLWRLRIYPPPAFFWWWFCYDAYAPHIFVQGAYIAASGGLLAVAVAIALSVWRAREAKSVETYGSARWAKPEEIAEAGLLGPDGVVLGRHRRDYLRHDGPEHVLCFAPTRSGKGVGLVMPTLLTWPGSAIVHDIKGENWRLTAGFRGRFGRVLLFDPTNPASLGYNPLLEVRRGAQEVRDVQNIADILVDPEGSLEKRNHWERTSHALLVGAILHVLYAETDKTLAGVAELLSDPKRTIEATLSAMMRPRTGARPASIRSWPPPPGSCSTNRSTSAPASSRPPCRSSASIATRWWPRSPGAATGRSTTWSAAHGRPASIWSCRPPTSAGPNRWCG